MVSVNLRTRNPTIAVGQSYKTHNTRLSGTISYGELSVIIKIFLFLEENKEKKNNPTHSTEVPWVSREKSEEVEKLENKWSKRRRRRKKNGIWALRQCHQNQKKEKNSKGWWLSLFIGTNQSFNPFHAMPFVLLYGRMPFNIECVFARRSLWLFVVLHSVLSFKIKPQHTVYEYNYEYNYGISVCVYAMEVG